MWEAWDRSLRGVTRRLIWTVALTVAAAIALLCRLQVAFGWGHEVIARFAEHYMASGALATTSALLGGATIDTVASWADDYRRDHPETGPWQYIDIPTDLATECPNESAVVKDPLSPSF
jgi:hypothetical protein